jgi:hypothetical protein
MCPRWRRRWHSRSPSDTHPALLYPSRTCHSRSGDLVFWYEHLPLLIPHGRRLVKLLQREAVGLSPVEDGLDTIRGEQREPEHARQIGVVDADVASEFADAGVAARLQQFLPAVGAGDGHGQALVRADLFANLADHLRPGARLTFVVGNARYSGVHFPVDELLAEVAVNAGYEPLEIRTIRYGGNSAQQMGEFGRERSREARLVLSRSG